MANRPAQVGRTLKESNGLWPDQELDFYVYYEHASCEKSYNPSFMPTRFHDLGDSASDPHLGWSSADSAKATMRMTNPNNSTYNFLALSPQCGPVSMSKLESSNGIAFRIFQAPEIIQIRTDKVCL